jgi:hypothetical protein
VDPSRYQRVRLWSGVTSIGSNLAFVWSLALTSSLWAGGCSGILAVAITLLGAALVMTAANLPFDILCGHAVETALDRTDQSFGDWLLDWFRNRAMTAAGLWTGMAFFSLLGSIPDARTPLMFAAASVMILVLFGTSLKGVGG